MRQPGADPDMAGRAARPSGASCVGQCTLLPRKNGGGARCAGRYQGPGRSLQAAVFEQSRSAGGIPVWSSGRAAGKVHPHPLYLRHDRQARRRVLHEGGYRPLERLLCACAGSRGCRPGGCMSGRVWLRPVHRRLRTQRRQSEARLPDAADVLRQHRPAAAIYGGSRFDRFVLHTVLRGVSG